MTTNGTYRPRHAASDAGVGCRMTFVVVGLLAATLAATLLLWPAGGASRTAGSEVAHSEADSPEALWRERVESLYDVRAAAFDEGEVGPLFDVYTADSRQLRTDVDTIQALRAQQRTVVGFAPQVLEVQVLEVPASGVDGENDESVVLTVRDEIAEFVIRDTTGTEMPVAGRGPADVTMTLRLESGRWLIADAVRADG